MIRRAVGKLSNLDAQLRGDDLRRRARPRPHALGDAREAEVPNAHPHRAGSVAIIHNGIVENYREIRAELEAAGCTILSDTDTELVAHLIEPRARGGRRSAHAPRAPSRSGWSARTRWPSSRRARPTTSWSRRTAVARSSSASATASRSSAATSRRSCRTRARCCSSADGEFAVLSRDGVQLVDAERPPDRARAAHDPVGSGLRREGRLRPLHAEGDLRAAARAARHARHAPARGGRSTSISTASTSRERAVKNIERVTLVACGTAHYACLVGKYLIEQLAGIPCEVDLASEYRYRQARSSDAHSCSCRSPSRARRPTRSRRCARARARGARVLAICNTRDSAIARESHDVLYTNAGPEIGVASTKCFTAQFLALYLLAMKLGIARQHARRRRRCTACSPSCAACRAWSRSTLALDGADPRRWRRSYFRATNFLFLGRGIMYPIALEGALKLKEISYIHAEGYAAGEMKHGPIALIDENMPVVVIANAEPGLRQDDLQPRAGARARRPGDRDRQRGRRGDRREGGRGDPHPRARRVPDRAARHDPGAAARLPRGRRSRAPTSTSRATSRRA